MSARVWPLFTRTLSGRGPGLGAGCAAAAARVVSGFAAATGAGALAGMGAEFGAGADAAFGAAFEDGGLCAGAGFAALEGGSSAAALRSLAADSPVPRAAFAR